jgi:hypothetical protein
MSLFDALSAPSEYTLGALSGNFGERRTGEDLTGDITSGILLEIIADPLNLIGAGIGAGGALASKIVRRLDKFNDWNKATERIANIEAASRRLIDEGVLEKQMAKTAVGRDFFREAAPRTKKRSLVDVLLGDVEDVERGVMYHGTAAPFKDLDEFGNPIWNMDVAEKLGLAKPGARGVESSRGPGFYNALEEGTARGYAESLSPYKEGLTAEETTTIRELLTSTADDYLEAGRRGDLTGEEMFLLDDLSVDVSRGIKGFERGGVGKLDKRAAAINEDTLTSLEQAKDSLGQMSPEGLPETVSETIEDILKAKTPEEGLDPTVYKSRIRTDEPLDVREGARPIPREEAARIYERIGATAPVGDVPADEVGRKLMRHKDPEHKILSELGYDSLIHTKEQGSGVSDIMTWEPEKMFSGIRRRYRPTTTRARMDAQGNPVRSSLKEVLATYLEAGGSLDRVDAARAVGGGVVGLGGMGGIRAMLGAYDEEEEL